MLCFVTNISRIYQFERERGREKGREREKHYSSQSERRVTHLAHQLPLLFISDESHVVCHLLLVRFAWQERRREGYSSVRRHRKRPPLPGQRERESKFDPVHQSGDKVDAFFLLSLSLFTNRVHLEPATPVNSFLSVFSRSLISFADCFDSLFFSFSLLYIQLPVHIVFFIPWFASGSCERICSWFWTKIVYTKLVSLVLVIASITPQETKSLALGGIIAQRLFLPRV